MDELAKAMKVIRLRDERYGQYLTAGDDQVSVTLTEPSTEGYNPKNTEWRLQWLAISKGLVCHVRLWSIYDKALTFTEDPDDYYCNVFSDALIQQPWPPSHGGEAASEWQLKLLQRKNSDVTLTGFLCKWSKIYNESLRLTPIPGVINKTCFTFETIHTHMLFKWSNRKWYIEVVVENNNNGNDNITTSSVNQKISTSSPREHLPLMQSPQGSANKMATSSEIGTLVKNNRDSPYHPHDTSLIDANTRLSTAVKQKTSTPPDQFMNPFSSWQVGQVYFHMFPNTTGGNTSHGYKYDQYANSGRNVNGSGVQKNGDVNTYSEINRSRDNTTNFVNYKYE